MNTRIMRSSLIGTALAATIVGLAGCDLDVENPNAPDVDRALSDPAGLEQLIAGGFRTWMESRTNYYSGIPMNTMADSYTASWNNAASRFYSSVGSDGCAARCGWTNSATAPEAAGGPSVEAQWYGFYTVLSSANDVLAAIDRGVCFDGDFSADDCAADNTLTSRNTAVAKMLQGMALAGIALNYDQGFIVDETTDLAAVLTAPFDTRDAVRDAALAKFEEAYTEAGLKTWSTGSNWFGVGSGRTYTNTQIRQLIRTMQAELVAMFARDDVENAATDWTAVVNYASAGISSGTAFDFEYYVDASGAIALDYVKAWGNAILTERVDNRVASILTTNHVNPWPEPAGNPCPYASADRRVGDGSFGPSNNFSGAATIAATANAGSDFACSGVAIFPAARGQYHQSNMQHVRYQHLTYEGEGLPGFIGVGQDPMYTRQMNDLLWAEGEIRRAGGSLAVAATRINNSRVGRGNLTGVAAGDGVPALLNALRYEQIIEFMGQGGDAFYNRRRMAPNCTNPCGTGNAFGQAAGARDGLITGTPRHMPVPAKELDVLLRSVYTFGGAGPAKLVAGASRETVADRWREIQAMHRTHVFKKKLDMQ
jgi:hypothetical protein